MGKMMNTKWKKGLVAIASLLAIILIGIFINSQYDKPDIYSHKVSGDSMLPTLQNNETIHVDHNGFKNRAPDYNELAIAFKSVETKELMVKRVVGKPGDIIQIKNGTLYRNDVAVKENILPGIFGDVTGYGERLELKDNEYYLLGDNTGESADSRSLGAIDFENFVGKVISK